jgi:hypothetical protein
MRKVEQEQKRHGSRIFFLGTEWTGEKCQRHSSGSPADFGREHAPTRGCGGGCASATVHQIGHGLRPSIGGQQLSLRAEAESIPRCQNVYRSLIGNEHLARCIAHHNSDP